VSERLVPLAQIVTTHGLDGWLKLSPFNPETTAFEAISDFYVVRDGMQSLHRVEACRFHKRHVLCKLAGIDDIDAAAPLVGATLCVAEASLPPLESGEYYHYQAVGLEVFDTEGRRLGMIVQTWSTGGGEIYIVAGDEKEYLIPAVKDIIESVDFDKGRMIIDPPDGLLDL
jgi:16S rRNA processing protein RimM